MQLCAFEIIALETLLQILPTKKLYDVISDNDSIGVRHVNLRNSKLVS